MKRNKTARTINYRYRWFYTKIDRKTSLEVPLGENLNVEWIKAIINILPSEIEL